MKKWKWKDDNLYGIRSLKKYLEDEQGELILNISGYDGKEFIDVNVDYEHMIAAAPMMLEALKKASTCASIPDSVMSLVREALKEASRKK